MMRGAALMAWAATQAGLYPVDVLPAFDDLDTQLSGDGLHPLYPGHQRIGGRIFDEVIGGADG